MTQLGAKTSVKRASQCPSKEELGRRWHPFREGKGRREVLCLVSCHKNSFQGISENHKMYLSTLRHIFKSTLCQNLSPV